MNSNQISLALDILQMAFATATIACVLWSRRLNAQERAALIRERDGLRNDVKQAEYHYEQASARVDELNSDVERLRRRVQELIEERDGIQEDLTPNIRPMEHDEVMRATAMNSIFSGRRTGGDDRKVKFQGFWSHGRGLMPTGPVEIKRYGHTLRAVQAGDRWFWDVVEPGA